MNLIQTIEAEEIGKLNKTVPEFRPGDTLRVGVKVVEGDRSRVQNFEGVCNRALEPRHGLQLHGPEGVVRRKAWKRVFPLYSPNVDSVEVVRRGAVRRAKLYYLRGRTGKAARIKERRDNRPVKEDSGGGVSDASSSPLPR